MTDDSYTVEFFTADELDEGNLYAFACLHRWFGELWPREEIALPWSGDHYAGLGNLYI